MGKKMFDGMMGLITGDALGLPVQFMCRSAGQRSAGWIQKMPKHGCNGYVCGKSEFSTESAAV